MQITEITVSYEATQSLSDYSNVRPGVRLTAVLVGHDDPTAVQQTLLNEARSIVQEEIDDCLIADGKAPRYYDGPRYQVVYNRETRIVAILPNETKPIDLPGPGAWFHKTFRRMRLDQARGIAQDLAQDHDWRLIDCHEGDLSPLVELERFIAQEQTPAPDVPHPDDDDEEL